MTLEIVCARLAGPPRGPVSGNKINGHRPLGFVPKRDSTISRTALAAGFAAKPAASAARLIVLGQSLKLKTVARIALSMKKRQHANVV